MSELPGVALAGCGRIAQQFHLPLLAASGTARLLAVADADDGAREAALRLTSGRSAVGLRDWRQLVDLPGVDAVVVALPTDLHAEVAIAALRAGRHVYVEKPLATDAAAAAEAARTWAGSGLVGMMGFNFRAHPLARALRDRVLAGQLGTLVGVRTAFCSAPRALPGWKQVRRTGGGALLDLASHHVDLLRFLLDDEFSSVTATIRSVRTEEDTASITAKLTGGAVVQTFVSTSAAQTDRVELIGDAGTLTWDRMRRRQLQWTPSSGPTDRAARITEAGRVLVEGLRSTVDGLRPPPEPSFATALESFLAAVARGDATAGPTLADGHRSLQVLEAAERAAASGREEHVGGAGEPSSAIA